MKQKLVINGRLPGLNEVVDTARRNKNMSAAQKKLYTGIVAWSCKACKLKPVEGLSNYFFIWYCKDRRRDKDNIMSSQKYIFDGLQEAGIIVNDGWFQVGNITHKFLLDNNERVEVIIDKVEDD